METLAERIAREGPVNELDAVGWIVRLAKKLESMHSRGLAHGGVSPEAMKTASASRLSLGMLVPTGATRNRLEFRSPERLDGASSSPTDDTWSTAVTLYALITGASPFVGADDDATRKKIRSGVFAPLSTFDVGDDDLQHIIDAALNPSFAERTSSMAAFREALEGWHPDSKVRELPPMVDDQPDDDDDDARTVMRPVSAADAVRQLIAQREQAAAARASDPPPSAAKETASSTNESAAKAGPVSGPVVAQNHGLLEDDDENAKTAMISVPPLAYLGNKGPATVPAPPPTDMMKSAPPPPPVSTGFNMARAPGGTAARAPAGRASPKTTVVGGFTAKQAIEQYQQQRHQAPPVAAPAPPSGISRDAVLEDGDNEATVMREAPLEVLRKATASIAPPVPDRTTPVDPTSAVVAAMNAASDVPPAQASAPPPVRKPAPSFPWASPSDNLHEGAGVKPQDLPASPAMGSNATSAQENTAHAAPLSGKTSSTPLPSTAEKAPTPGLATSSLTAPSTPGMAAPVAPAPRGASSPAIAVPAPVATPVLAAPLAKDSIAPPPAIAANPPQPNALKGLLIGVGLALVLIAAAAGVYFFVVKG